MGPEGFFASPLNCCMSRRGVVVEVIKSGVGHESWDKRQNQGGTGWEFKVSRLLTSVMTAEGGGGSLDSSN